MALGKRTLADMMQLVDRHIEKCVQLSPCRTNIVVLLQMFRVCSHVDVDRHQTEQTVHSALKHCIISLFAKQVGSQHQLNSADGNADSVVLL